MLNANPALQAQFGKTWNPGGLDLGSAREQAAAAKGLPHMRRRQEAPPPHEPPQGPPQPSAPSQPPQPQQRTQLQPAAQPTRAPSQPHPPAVRPEGRPQARVAEREADGSAGTWRVVGPGGLIVRAGKALTSPRKDQRLASGACVRELELDGERLRYELREGSGPRSGWVSLRNQELMRGYWNGRYQNNGCPMGLLRDFK